MKPILPFLFMVLVLKGCSSDLQNIRLFQATTPVTFDAENLEVVIREPVTFQGLDQQKQPIKKFEEAIHLWAASTLAPTGNDGNLFVTVEKAQLTETPLLSQKHGMDALFTKEPASRLDGRMAVRLQLMDAHGTVKGSAYATVERSVTMQENMTLAARDQRIEQLCHNLIGDLDIQMRKAIDDGGLASGARAPY